MSKIYNELPTVFPIYDKLEKQQRFRENAAKAAVYKLITPEDRLLPFQLVSAIDLSQATKWELFNSCDELAVDISFNIPKMKARKTDIGFYVTYIGDALSFSGATGQQTLKIPEGLYYAKITFPEKTYYSEFFTVVLDVSKYMKLEFFNDCDLKPIHYNGSNFKQIVYLDTFVHTSEPEVEEEGERDGENTLIPTFQKLSVKHRAAVVVPDFLKIALTSTQIHTDITLTTNYGARTGQIDRITTTSVVDADGAFSTVDLLLEEILITKDKCCDNAEITDGNVW